MKCPRQVIWLSEDATQLTLVTVTPPFAAFASIALATSLCIVGLWAL